MLCSRSVGLASFALVTGALALSSLQGCRQSRRSVRVGADSATLKVTMELPPEDLSRADWLYELSGCTPVMNGSLEGKNVAIFKGIGLKKGLTGCQMRIKILNPTPAITFAAGTEPNVLFWAKDVPISQDASGALVATASFQRLYSIAAGEPARAKFTLNAKVKFAVPETAKPMTAQLVCAPKIYEAGFYPEDNPVDGQFTFIFGLNEPTEYKCTDIQVGVLGAPLKYVGKIAAADQTIAAKPNEAFTTTGVIALELQQQQPPATDGGVAVSIEAKECNMMGKVFDTATHTCVDAPKPATSGSGSAGAGS